MINGFFNVIKPTGMTSSDVVVKVRGIVRNRLGDKDARVGHFGTLDPAGAGVLPVAVGRATRLFDYAAKEHKIYRAGFAFGTETDTLDSYGTTTKTGEKMPDIGELLQVLPKFIGKIVQIPPRYSSKSIDGKRAYDLARDGVEFNLDGRNVEIFSIKCVGTKGDSYVFDIECSGGTYIRSLVRDIAQACGTVAYMSFIIRLKAGYFNLEDSVTLDKLEENPEKYLLPIEYFTDNLPKFFVPETLSDKVLNGTKLEFDNLPSEDMAVYVNGKLLGLGINENGFLKVVTRLV